MLIAISDIRLANIKMIEGSYDKQLSNSFKNIIDMQNAQINILQNNLTRQKYINVCLTDSLNDANNSIKKYKRQRTIYAGSSIGLLAIILGITLL